MEKGRVIEFFKLQASGNDFVLIDNRRGTGSGINLKKIAKKLCERKFGIGADGILVIEPSKKGDFTMRIFNPDGSEAEMCGNGARCTALWAKEVLKRNYVRFQTKAGIIEAQVEEKGLRKDRDKPGEYNRVRIKMSDPYGLRLDLHVKVFSRTLRVHYINTGVPHTIVFVEGLDNINVAEIGRALRFHKAFRPVGTNVDFVEVIGDKFIKIRTYERGVEAETLACGTGVVASAIITGYKLTDSQSRKYRFDVLTKSGEKLKVYFARDVDKITDVWLEGKAYLVYTGKVPADCM